MAAATVVIAVAGGQVDGDDGAGARAGAAAGGGVGEGTSVSSFICSLLFMMLSFIYDSTLYNIIITIIQK